MREEKSEYLTFILEVTSICHSDLVFAVSVKF